MSYAQLTLEERFVIYHLRLYKLSIREIARRLNRSHSTISRELKRNAPILGTVYWAVGAQQRAEKRRGIARHVRRRSNERLCRYVEQRLQAHWSPEAIAGRIKLDFAHELSMRVSHEAI